MNYHVLQKIYILAGICVIKLFRIFALLLQIFALSQIFALQFGNNCTEIDQSQSSITCVYIMHLMSAPEGNSEFCFPETLNVSRDEVEGNIESRGKTKLTIS